MKKTILLIFLLFTSLSTFTNGIYFKTLNENINVDANWKSNDLFQRILRKIEKKDKNYQEKNLNNLKKLIERLLNDFNNKYDCENEEYIISEDLKYRDKSMCNFYVRFYTKLINKIDFYIKYTLNNRWEGDNSKNKYSILNVGDKIQFSSGELQKIDDFRKKFNIDFNTGNFLEINVNLSGFNQEQDKIKKTIINDMSFILNDLKNLGYLNDDEVKQMSNINITKDIESLLIGFGYTNSQFKFFNVLLKDYKSLLDNDFKLMIYKNIGRYLYIKNKDNDKFIGSIQATIGTKKDSEKIIFGDIFGKTLYSYREMSKNNDNEFEILKEFSNYEQNKELINFILNKFK